MQIVRGMQEREVTSRIRIDQLQGLLVDTTQPGPEQRVTARMPAVTLEQLLLPEEPPPPVQVTFRVTPRATDAVTPIEDELDATFDPRADTLSDAAPVEVRSLELARGTIPTPIVERAIDAAHPMADDDFEDFDEPHATSAESPPLGTVNGVPVHVAGVNSAAIISTEMPVPQPAIDAVIDAAVDAAIDAEIHNAEIDAAIDAVVLPFPTDAPATSLGALAALTSLGGRMRFARIALAFTLCLLTGVLIMYLLG